MYGDYKAKCSFRVRLFIPIEREMSWSTIVQMGLSLNIPLKIRHKQMVCMCVCVCVCVCMSPQSTDNNEFTQPSVVHSVSLPQYCRHHHSFPPPPPLDYHSGGLEALETLHNQLQILVSHDLS